jgi:hypothetical protein
MSKLEAANLLQALASEFERLGFEVRRTPHLFADNGLSIGKAGALGVHLYVTASGPTARVTEHGGRQWTLACTTADDLRHAALSALQTDRIPPSSLWRIEDEYLYHAWFLDPRMPEGDQDREWVAVLSFVLALRRRRRRGGTTCREQEPSARGSRSYLRASGP